MFEPDSPPGFLNDFPSLAGFRPAAPGDPVGDRSLRNAKENSSLALGVEVDSEVFLKTHRHTNTIGNFLASRNYYATSVPLFTLRPYPLGMDWQGWGKRLKAHMKTAGVTQDALAEKMDVTQGAIAHWLSGRREINLNDYFKLCALAAADPRAVLFGETIPSTSVINELRELITSSPELQNLLNPGVPAQSLPAAPRISPRRGKRRRFPAARPTTRGARQRDDA